MTKRKDGHQRNEALVALRKQRGWTQFDAAGACEVEPGAYQAWERGICKPKIPHLLQICEVFGVTPEEAGFELQEREQLALQLHVPLKHKQ